MIKILLYLIFCFVGLFLGDYLFNGKKIIEAKATGKPFIMFVYHGGIHALIQCWVYQVFGIYSDFSEFWWMILFIFLYTIITHSLTDYYKTKITLSNQWMENSSFNKSRWWFIFGIDQLIHNISIIIMVGIIFWITIINR